jgi:hypothetical protein
VNPLFQVKGKQEKGKGKGHTDFSQGLLGSRNIRGQNIDISQDKSCCITENDHADFIEYRIGGAQINNENGEKNIEPIG